MDKYIKDGYVAVLHSPNYGAGWYTSNTEFPEIVFDPTIVDMLLQDFSFEKIRTYVTLKYPDIYLGGLNTLCIAWVKVGEKFLIHEYDGDEEVWVASKIDWLEA